MARPVLTVNRADYITAQDIANAQRAFNMDDAWMGRALGGYARTVIYQYRIGNRPISWKFSETFRAWLATCPTPRPDWTPDPTHFAFKDVAGYMHRHVCGVGAIENVGKVEPKPDSCGREYWATYHRRVYCTTCRPFKGKK